MKKNLIALKDILIKNGLSSGYSFRGKITNQPDGDLKIIQMKDINYDYTTIQNTCTYINSDKIKDKYHLNSGDILFTGKGANNFALVYKDIDEIPTIASSALFVIKVDKSKANPNFIAWYINQSPVQNYLKTNEAGTYVTNVNKKTVLNIPILLPNLEMQNKISLIASLHLREKQLTREISSQRNTLISHQLINSIN
jgi:restriction endonuclease S subunit